jgi:prevent-host-death family protein
VALIGIRELRENTSEVLRKVREEKAEYIITHQGQPVAVLLPVEPEMIEKAMLEAGKQSALGGWYSYKMLIESLRAEWPEGQDTQSILDEIRED